MDLQNQMKQAVALAAVDQIENGMILGLGSGSTAALMIEALAMKIKSGEIKDVVGVTTSFQGQVLATELGIPLKSLSSVSEIDLAIDGADEVDPNFQLIKGGGACHVQEKLVAALAKKFIVVVDAVNGAGYDAVPQLLETLNCEVIRINCDPSGDFVRGPEPLANNLEMLSDTVKKTNADIGLALDPDADRLAVVSNMGKPIGDEYTLALAADGFIRQKKSKETFVINLSTSMILEKIANKNDCKVISTAVGEINVVEKMIEIGAELGGEGNGGVILKESHLGRDSLVACALVLNRLAQTNESIHDIFLGLPQFVIVKDKIELSSNDLDDLISYSKNIFEDAKINNEDGTKFIWKDKWIHLRKSNTEPIVRIYAEAKDKTIAQDLIKKVKLFIDK